MRSYDSQFLPLPTPGCPRSCPLSVRSPSIRRPMASGRVAEWFKAAVLKTFKDHPALYALVALGPVWLIWPWLNVLPCPRSW
jgi:hypothetical protein